MMARIDTWEALKEEAYNQITDKVAELEERAEFLQKYLDKFKDTVDDGPEALNDLRNRTDVSEYDDDEDIEAIQAIYFNWPHIKSKPGEGYW